MLSALVDDGLQELRRQQYDLKRQLLEAERKNRLERYRPYPKQYDFHAAGASFRERLLVAGNQTGKTFSAAHEVAMHLTGVYPDWWMGHRFDDPNLWWTGAVTNEKSKEIIQQAFLGTQDASMRHPDMGTGTIPGRYIRRVTTRQAGVKNVVDEITVEHRPTGKDSRVCLKTYDMKAAKWTGVPVDGVWADEEPDEDIDGEIRARTQKKKGLILMTFTPLKGKSKVYQRFADNDMGADKRSLTRMTIYDAMHYTPEDCAEIVESYDEWERECRTLGVPISGHGRVFTFSRSEISCKPFPLDVDQKKHWRRICGIDFGSDHPAAGAWLAYDADVDIVYLYDCYRRRREQTAYHAEAIKARGAWIPVAWPHDGMETDKNSGPPLYQSYMKHGVKMLPFSARYDDEKGGSQATEPIIDKIIERMKTGRFKVFEGLEDYFEEMAYYHRDNKAHLVRKNDDLISAVNYAMMMLRYAATKQAPHSTDPIYAHPMVT